jgi:hypothetical protein
VVEIVVNAATVATEVNVVIAVTVEIAALPSLG